MNRKRICLLGAPLDNFYSREFWKGTSDEATRLGLDFVFLAGGLQISYFGGFSANCALNESRSTILYQMVDPSQFDGILIWGAQWAHDGDQELIQSVLAAYAPLPIVSVGWSGKGVYTVLPDNYSGMRQLAAHLINEHGHSKIAFLKSESSFVQWESEQRFQAYCDELESNHIELDSRLIVYGHEIEGQRKESQRHQSKSIPWGVQAIEELLDRRGLLPGRDFTALMARDDDSALMAIHELKRRGVSVPRDVAVCGFDNIRDGRCSSPALSTVPQSFSEQGATGIRLLGSILNGELVPAVTVLEARQPIIRESCGCANYHLRSALQEAAFEGGLTSSASAIKEQVAAVLNGIPGAPPVWANLQDVIEEGLTALRQNGQEPLEMAEFVSRSLPAETEAARQRLIHAVLIYIGDRAQHFQLREHIVSQNLQDELETISRDIFHNYNIDQVLDSVEAELPIIGAQGCTILLFSDPINPLGYARVLFSSSSGVRRTGAGLDSPQFPTSQILSREFWSQSNIRHSLYVEPLFFASHRIGCLILEKGESDGRAYTNMSLRLASVLEGAFIVRNLNEKQAELEKAYAEILSLSERDALTGLFNRRVFQREILNEKLRMDRYANRERRVFSILFIDLDNFKHYNDVYGHAVGDAALIVFAQLISGSVRTTDRISRFGGDEFLVLLPETHLEGAIILAERVLSSIHDIERFHERIQTIVGYPITVERTKYITCSIGIAVYKKGDGLDELIQRADQALYVAKKTGRDRYCTGDQSNLDETHGD
jgi:diguanylate cyclase (GGDEF)-like protein